MTDRTELLTGDERTSELEQLSAGDCGFLAAALAAHYPEVFDALLLSLKRWPAGLEEGDALMETPETIAKAADVIAERGWHVGNYKDPSGCGVCVLGAISVAAGAEPDAIGTIESPAGAEAAVRAFEGWLECGMDLADWNDEVAEDADEVITALRECAASLKAGA